MFSKNETGNIAYTSSHCAKYVAASFAPNVLNTLLIFAHNYQLAAIFLDFVSNVAHVICTNLVQLPVRVASPVPSSVYDWNVSCSFYPLIVRY